MNSLYNLEYRKIGQWGGINRKWNFFHILLIVGLEISGGKGGGGTKKNENILKEFLFINY